LPSQISKLKGRFSLERVVLVGDRGMITEARLKKTIKPAGLMAWATCGHLNPALIDISRRHMSIVDPSG